MKNNKKIVNVTTIIVIMIIIITIWQCFKIVDTPLKIKDEEIIEVAEGDSFYGVLNKLSEEDNRKTVIEARKQIRYRARGGPVYVSKNEKIKTGINQRRMYRNPEKRTARRTFCAGRRRLSLWNADDPLV